MRIACAVGYLGTHYAGWAKQKEHDTVQGRVEAALSKIAASEITVGCAGRTDAGVHGCYQVIHFDTPIKRARSAWILGTNTHLPPDIRILWAKPTINRFHARHQALSRRYQYWIDNQAVHSPFSSTRATWVPNQLSHEAMHEAAQVLRGEHDFSAFRAASCGSHSKHRYVFDVNVTRHAHRVCIDITANAFLHHMVRNIAGSLIEVGLGRRSTAWIAELLEAKDRKLAGQTASPDGLYLVDVLYPDEFELPVARLYAAMEMIV